MKKQLAVIAVLLLVVGLSGCINQERTTFEDISDDTSEKEFEWTGYVEITFFEILDLSATESAIDITVIVVNSYYPYVDTFNEISYDIYYRIPERLEEGGWDWDSGSYNFLGSSVEERKVIIEEDVTHIHIFFTLKNQRILQTWLSLGSQYPIYLKIEGTANLTIEGISYDVPVEQFEMSNLTPLR